MINPNEGGLPNWESYYVIVGSSSAALIGLQFVVITLLAGIRAQRTPTAISAFATPTVVHFVGALVIAATMTTPWTSLSAPALALLIAGLLGSAYGVQVVLQARRQTTYTPVWEDWLWHMILPCTAYAALVIAALLAFRGVGSSMFAVAACALTLLLVGIHNAWDTVTYIVTLGTETHPELDQDDNPSAP
jgi:hypothetical protein